MNSVVGSPAPEVLDPGFSISHQRVDLELDLLSRSLRGRTYITLVPLGADSKAIKLNLRQCEIDYVRINGEICSTIDYEDCYQRAKLPYTAGVHQYHMVLERLQKLHKDGPESELVIGLPKKFKLKEEFFPELAQGPADANSRFAPIELRIDFWIKRIRDGMQFIGLDEGDLRYPHAYSLNSSGPQGSRCLFPCVDAVDTRCTWDISVKTARTIGDIFKQPSKASQPNGISRTVNGQKGPQKPVDKIGASFSADDKAMEIIVLCSGEQSDQTVDPKDPSRRTTSFHCEKEISAKHVGIIVGALEEVDLSFFRGSDEDDRLGQSAIPVLVYCTPGRAEEVKTTCCPIVQAIDYNVIPFGSFPYSIYKMCFVDDCPSDVLHTSMLSICSSSLIFRQDTLDPVDDVTKKLVHALATQWFGIDLVAKGPEDIWVIYGLSYFMTDAFLKTLCGRNEYRYRQKLAVDKVVELDVDRPSLVDLGHSMDLDPSQEDFMALKAPLVLFILDQRILKSGQSAGVSRIINRILLNAKTGGIENNALETKEFVKLCDRLSHLKLDQFFQQWVSGSGCPKFSVSQRFNKKKLVVEMTIKQIQGASSKDKMLDPSTFMRDVKEEANDVYAGPLQQCFTGPMTIRIHEADGTPYEHIVQINQAVQHLEVPYNTKYKRIKRNRKEKQRTVKDDDGEYEGDETGEALLYSLGDVLQSEGDMKAWKFRDWDNEDEKKMSNESYEWIRMDADFEWICNMRLAMPGYMYISQLQQDRDVVAQYESVKYLGTSERGHPLISTFLTRTLLDTRYFHGVRTAAAAALAGHTSEKFDYIALFHLEKVFKELYCYPGSTMIRPNDFSDRAAYLVQCAIAKAFGDARDDHQRSPFQARRWILDKLKYNDNSHNDFSDSHYIATLMNALASAITSRRPFQEVEDFEDPGEDNIIFHNACLEELERYRRADEWTASYSNVITRTALNCRAMFIKSKFLKFNPLDFLRYTSDLASPVIRIAAQTYLLTISQHKQPHILRYYLCALGTDPSPVVRDALLQHLGLILSRIAIGTDAPSTTSNVETKVGDLVVETDVTTEAHKADFSRKHTIAGALDALKLELSSNVTLQEGLWAAITSPVISLHQMEQLLEICDKLYIPKTMGLIVFKYPRYWSCHRVGKGKVKFVQDGAFRFKPLPKKEIAKMEAPPATKLKITIKGGLNSGGTSGGHARTTSTSASPAPDAGGGVRKQSMTTFQRPIFKQPRPPVERAVSSGSVGGEAADGGSGTKPKLVLKFNTKSGSPA